MEWTNEMTLEFLEMFQKEPCPWNPNLKTYKNRMAVNGAWTRINQGLSFEANVEELKKRKASLMGYYRIHLNNYKKSLKSAAGPDDIYSTGWFAFEVMHGFLNPIYGSKYLLDTQSPEEKRTKKTINESEEEISKNGSNLDPLATIGNCSNIQRKFPPAPSIHRQNNAEILKRRHFQTQTPETASDLANTKKQMDDAFEHLKSIKSTQNIEKLDEYDYFAFMIASKIRKLENPDDREALMNSIQNFTFEYYMKSKPSKIVTPKIKFEQSADEDVSE